MTGRVVHAGLQLLDRQLVDRNGRLCGKVDDLTLSEPDEDGVLYITGILTGPGALLQRTGRLRLGGWLRRMLGVAFDGVGERTEISLRHIASLGDHITVSLDAEQLPTHAGERWVRDHIVRHLPGNGIETSR